MTLPVAVFASGSGSNLQALLDYEGHTSAYRVVLLITDRECGAESRAKEAGRPVVRVAYQGRDSAEIGGDILAAFDDVADHDGGTVGLVCLAGFTRLVPPSVTKAFRDRVLNVHPALLPAFGGKGMYGSRVHAAVVESGAVVTGPTVHLVNERYDEGRILAQWPVPVLPDDSPEAVAARVLAAEHLLYPVTTEAVARAVASGEPIPRFVWRHEAREPSYPSHVQHRMREAFRPHE